MAVVKVKERGRGLARSTHALRASFTRPPGERPAVMYNVQLNHHLHASTQNTPIELTLAIMIEALRTVTHMLCMFHCVYLSLCPFLLPVPPLCPTPLSFLTEVCF